jgi:hypothetical protein
MKKLSKSDQDIEAQKAQEAEDLERLARMKAQKVPGQQPGDPCIIWIGRNKYKGHYTETGWEIEYELRPL